MKNKHLYVPILKYKPAEITALNHLTVEQKKNVIPLFFIVHQFDRARGADGQFTRFDRPRTTILQNAINDLRGFGSPVMLDISVLWESSEKNAVWEQVANNGGTLFGNDLVPVITTDDLATTNYSTTTKVFFVKQGVGIRLFKEDLTENIWDKIDSFIGDMGLKKAKVHLIFDYGETNPNELPHILSLLSDERAITSWQQVTIASGSFREDLGGLTVDTHKHPRDDWKLWKNVVQQNSGDVPIGYGDYTIQFAVYKIPPEVPNPSRSIKYAKDEYWLLLKGQTDTAEGSAQAEQYYGQLQILEDSGELNDAACCWGDNYIHSILQKKSKKNCGGFKEWVMAGINHHMSVTIGQLASLGQISD